MPIGLGTSGNLPDQVFVWRFKL